MSIIRKIGDALFGPDTSDLEYFEYVAEELGQGTIDKGIWAKALAETNYEEKKARARYIAIRVKSIKKQVAVLAAEQRVALDRRRVALDRRKELKSAYKRGKYSECLDGWKELAGDGDPEGMYIFAEMLAHGRGVQPSGYEAYLFAYLAELNGNSEAKALRAQLIPNMMSWDISRAEKEAKGIFASSSRSIDTR